MRGAMLAVMVVLAGVLLAVTGETPATAGAAPGETLLLSVAEDGGVGNDDVADAAEDVVLSANGRYAAFDTPVALDPLDAANDNGHTEYDVYVRDRQQPGHSVLISRGETLPPTAFVSEPAGADGDSRAPSLSATGRFVAFETRAGNLPDPDRDPESDIVVCDRDPDGDGVFDERAPDGSMAYRYVVVGRYGTPYSRLYDNAAPSISADGMTVAWNQQTIDSVYPPIAVVTHLSLNAGVLTVPPESDYLDTTPADTGEGGDAVEGTTNPPAVSADGKQVAFVVHFCGESCLTYLAHKPLLSLDGPPPQNVYHSVVEVEDLASKRTERMDVGPGGAALTGQSDAPSISGDGRIVTYAHYGESSVDIAYAVDRDPDGDGNLGPGGGEPVRTTIVSRDNTGAPAYGVSPVVSADGRYVAFETTAPNMYDGIDPPQSGPLSEIVVRDLVVDTQREAAQLPLLPGQLASVGLSRDCANPMPATGTCGANNPSYDPALSGDGSVVAFTSRATDLVDRPTQCCTGRAYSRAFHPVAHADPVDFGTVPVGSSSTRTITVRHNGFGPLHLTGVSVSGAEFTVFPAQTCVTATLYETGSCMVSVRFTPAADGQRAAVLRIDSATGPVPTMVPLSGGGGDGGGGVASGFSAGPNPLVFPVVRPALSASASLPVTVGNGGPVPWRIDAVSVVGGPDLFPGDFQVTASTCPGAVLQPGGTCRVSVVATAHGAGLRQAILSIADTSAGGPHLVGLALVGTTPTVQVTPGALPSGRVATVTGQGFPFGHPVTVSRQDAAPATVRTTAMGTFSVPLVIFDHALPGTFPIAVTSPGTTLRAEAPLLIVLGTFQPPGFTGRR